MSARRKGGFTLLELLVVIGLIAALSFFLASALTGGNKAVALQSAQATIANMVTAARTRAVASGKTTRLLINDNTANTAAYHRRIILAELNGTDWTALHSITLPQDVYLLPRNTHIVTGIYGTAGDWMTTDGKVLGSSCLDTTFLPLAYDSAVVENWEFVGFTARGTIETNQGSLVLAIGRIVPPGGAAPGSAPISMTDPNSVRGVQLSSYGVPRLINDRTGF